MTTLFQGTALASLTDDKPVRLVIEGFKDPEERLFLNSIEGEVQPNYQLLYAIGPGKYLDAFSQRLAPFVIAGTHILTTCSGAQVAAQAQPAFLTFYEQNNIVARAADNKGPLRITYNGIVLKCYLIKLTIGSYQKDGVDGHQFQLHVLADMPDPIGNRRLGPDEFDQNFEDRMAAFDQAVADRMGSTQVPGEATPGIAGFYPNMPNIGYTPNAAGPSISGPISTYQPMPLPVGPGGRYNRIT